MVKRMMFLVFALILAGPVAIRAQVPPEKALSTFTVVDGLQMTLWASEPLFVNPTCIDVDHKGRVWVCESVNYRSRLRGKPLLREKGDRILILEDTKGTGEADKVTVFYQSPETLAPLGIAVAKDPVGPGFKVFVCQSPDILVFEDKEGTGRADGPPRKLLSGFKGFDHDHGVHGILIGPDGKLYFSVGDVGVEGLPGKDGNKWTSNGTDCRAGTIWRCDLDGKNLELLAHNFRNEYEPCVDSFGTIFVSDNDDDGSQQTRICHVLPGGNYGYHPRGPGQSHWHEEQPGIVPKILRTHFGAPTGMCVYEGTLLPKKYQGQLLHTDAGPRQVRCYHLTARGAGYEVDREDMVTSTDNWFRPSDVCVGPDGSLYVADWYDPGVGGHGMGDTTRGRIFRIAPTGNTRPTNPSVDLESQEGITTALASPCLSVRSMAMAKLQSMDAKEAVDLLEKAAAGKDNPILRARALWQLGRLGRLRLVVGAFSDPDERFRMLAIRIFHDCQGHSPAQFTDDWKTRLLKDPSAAVRREALLALRDADPVAARGLILELAKQHDGKDVFYRCAVGIAIGQDKARRDGILADFDKTFPALTDAAIDLIFELRPPGAAGKLVNLLTDDKQPASTRARVVDILATSDDATVGKALLQALPGQLPPEIRTRIMEDLQVSLAGKWKDLRGSEELGQAIDALLKQPVNRLAALALIAAAEKNDALSKVLPLASDPAETEAVRSAAVRTLGSLSSAEAETALEKLLASAQPNIQAQAAHALGQYLTRKKDGPEAKGALRALQDMVLAKQNQGARLAALEALASNQTGGLWLLEMHDKKDLPESLTADAGRLLRSSPFKIVQNKAMLAFPPPGRIDPKKLPSIASLAQRKGNAEHGRQLLLASAKSDLQCMKCHTIRGQGGNVGPELSVIGKKASRDNLFESILYPSKAIADQYYSWIITTKKGVSYTGLIVEETPDRISMRDANGGDHKIAKKDIEDREKSNVSLMPDNLLVYMTEDDLVDIVEYLFGLKSPTLSVDYWHIAGPFDNGENDAGLDKAFPPEKALDLKATYEGKSGKVGWRIVKPDKEGYFDLQAFHGNDSDNSVSYMFREIESPADQEAEILLGTDDCGKLWIGDTLVFTNRAHRAAAPEQDRVKVKLKKGVNRLLLKVNNGNGAHGFYFTLLAEQEVKLLK